MAPTTRVEYVYLHCYEETRGLSDVTAHACKGFIQLSCGYAVALAIAKDQNGQVSVRPLTGLTLVKDTAPYRTGLCWPLCTHCLWLTNM